MNKVTRDFIAEMSNEGLELAIERDVELLHNTGKQLRSVRLSINTRLQALLDEKQKRMVDSWEK